MRYFRPLMLSALLSMLVSCAQPGPHQHPRGEDHGQHGPLGRRFEKAEEWARKFDSPERDAWQKPGEVVSSMQLARGMTVADLGAGTGYFLPSLSRAVGDSGTVLALDIEPGMVRYMEERAQREGLKNVKPLLVPWDDPQIAPASAHRILIVNTWHHIPDRTAYAGKLARGLAPGGTVTIVDFTLESSKGPPRHERVPPAKVVEELRAGGLVAEVAAEDLPEQYVVVGKK
ncbi:MAG: class I SAM-dependent methyltransferase [Planctomycetes bacterium]|nr:class I SAM-dependent methyltransferase [Planctomycetota bacterium]